MKYKIGDFLFYNQFDDFITPCKILKIFEKTRRYQIESKSGFVGVIEGIVHEKDLYNNEIEFRELYILKIERQILELQEKIKNLKIKITGDNVHKPGIIPNYSFEEQ